MDGFLAAEEPAGKISRVGVPPSPQRLLRVEAIGWAGGVVDEGRADEGRNADQT